MKNSLRIHKWTHNEFNIFILGVLTHPPYGIDHYIEKCTDIPVFKTNKRRYVFYLNMNQKLIGIMP